MIEYQPDLIDLILTQGWELQTVMGITFVVVWVKIIQWACKSPDDGE